MAPGTRNAQPCPRAGTSEIAGVIESYRSGTANAMEAGFDGVEVHALQRLTARQFWAPTATTHDNYGGSLEKPPHSLVLGSTGTR